MHKWYVSPIFGVIIINDNLHKFSKDVKLYYQKSKELNNDDSGL